MLLLQQIIETDIQYKILKNIYYENQNRIFYSHLFNGDCKLFLREMRIDNPKIEIKPQKEKEKDIYVQVSNDCKIVYWKNGVENILAPSDSKHGDALCIAVAGVDIYVAGRT